MKKPKFKSDLVLLFELASGWELGEYIYDRAHKGWTWARMSEEMNGMIRKLLTGKVLKSGLFRITNSNLSRWYKMFGVKSKARKGRKPNVSRETSKKGG